MYVCRLFYLLTLVQNSLNLKINKNKINKIFLLDFLGVQYIHDLDFAKKKKKKRVSPFSPPVVFVFVFCLTKREKKKRRFD